MKRPTGAPGVATGVLTRWGTIAGICILFLGAVAPILHAQDRGASLRVELGVEPARVTVGDPFRSMVRINAPPGYSVRFLEFASGDSLAALAAPALVESGGRTAAIYQLVAWAVAPALVAPIGIEVTAPDGSTRVHQLRLRLPEVVSVLPADTAGIVPRPARGMIAAPLTSPFPWWWLVLLLLALLLAWLLYRYLRRDRVIAEIDPRRWALQQLDDEHLKATLRPGDSPALVAHLSHVIREYIERTHPGLSRDLTTTELLDHLGRSPGEAALAKATLLAALLAQADRVKFARHRPHAAEAADLLTSARAWISRFPEETGVGETRRAA